MPVTKRKDGWYWGNKGPYKTKKKAEEIGRAAYASGYKKKESGFLPLGIRLGND